MTAREKKAVEIMRKSMPTVEGINMYDGITDEMFLKRPLSMGMEMILKGMEWQAEQCYREIHSCYEDKTVNFHNATVTRILNAGTEEVQP